MSKQFDAAEIKEHKSGESTGEGKRVAATSLRMEFHCGGKWGPLALGTDRLPFLLCD
jgi:hypothetical protein